MRFLLINDRRSLGLRLLAIAMLLSAPAYARDIYVSNVAGDDLMDGSSQRAISGNGVGTRNGPTATIAKALRIAQLADRIIIENSGKAYHESLSLQAAQHSGLAAVPFSLQGNGAVLDGSEPVSEDSWKQIEGDVYRFEPGRATTQQLFSDGLPLTMHPPGSRRLPLAALKPLEWTSDGQYIYFRTEANQVPRKYNLTYAKSPVGITLYKVSHVVIADLIVQGFQRDGINCNDTDGPCLLLRVNCRGNGRAGIGVNGAARVAVEDSIVGDNGQAQLLLDGLGQTLVRNCELLDNTAPRWKLLGGKLSIDGHDAANPVERRDTTEPVTPDKEAYRSPYRLTK